MTECVKDAVPDTASADNTSQNLTEVVVENDVPSPKGRVTEFRTEYCDIACRLKAAYFNDQDVAYTLGCSLTTLEKWKRNYSSFKAAIEDGRREQKKRLVARAMKQACGYTYIEKNVKHIMDSDGSVLKTEESEFHKENAGDSRLLVFLLCNLDRQLGDKEWQATNKIEVEESKSVTINIDGHAAREQIKKLSGDLLTNGMDIG